MQHADRIRSTLLFTHILDQRVDLSDTWNWRKRLQKKPACRYHEPRPIEMPQMELFTYPDTIQTGGFGIHVEDNSEQSIK